MSPDMSPEAARLLVRAQELGEEALAEVERLLVERAALDEQIKELRSIAKRFGAAEPARPKTASSRALKKEMVSPERMLRTARAILTLPNPSKFSMQELSKSMGYASVTSVRPAVERLRDAQFLGASVKELVNGAARPSQMYRVMDEHVIEMLEAQVDG